MARFDQCDETCTTDCGHCKGSGPPAVPDETPVQLGDSGLWVPTWARNKMEELDRG